MTEQHSQTSTVKCVRAIKFPNEEKRARKWAESTLMDNKWLTYENHYESLFFLLLLLFVHLTLTVFTLILSGLGPNDFCLHLARHFWCVA